MHATCRSSCWMDWQTLPGVQGWLQDRPPLPCESHLPSKSSSIKKRANNNNGFKPCPLLLAPPPPIVPPPPPHAWMRVQVAITCAPMRNELHRGRVGIVARRAEKKRLTPRPPVFWSTVVKQNIISSTLAHMYPLLGNGTLHSALRWEKSARRSFGNRIVGW